MIVADANLLVYLVVTTDETEAARAVFVKDPMWVAPPLWTSEVRSALLQHVRRGHLTPTQGIEAMGRARHVVVRSVEVNDAEVMRAALAFGLSAYDAEYVALAERLDVPLVTSDKRVLAAVGRADAPAAFAAG